MISEARWGFLEDPAHHFDFSPRSIAFHVEVVIEFVKQCFDDIVKFYTSYFDSFFFGKWPEGSGCQEITVILKKDRNTDEEIASFQMALNAQQETTFPPWLTDMPFYQHALQRYVAMKTDGFFQGIDTVTFFENNEGGSTASCSSRSGLLLDGMDSWAFTREIVDFVIAHEAHHFTPESQAIGERIGLIKRLMIPVYWALISGSPLVFLFPPLVLLCLIPLFHILVDRDLRRQMERSADRQAMEYLGSAIGALQLDSFIHKFSYIYHEHDTIYTPAKFAATFYRVFSTHPSALERWENARGFEGGSTDVEGDASRLFPEMFGIKTTRTAAQDRLLRDGQIYVDQLNPPWAVWVDLREL